MRFTRYDITRAPQPMLIHGCNARGVMGSGVALAIKKKWPEVERQYQKWLKLPDIEGSPLGSVNFANTTDGEKVVANLISQNYYGSDGKVYADLRAIRHGMNVVGAYLLARPFETKEIATVKIGCGLGGLKWDQVHDIFKQWEDRFGYNLVVYEWP